MWAKLTSVLKPRAAQDDHDPSLSSPPQPADGGMSKVFEQHSDLSVSNNKLERISSPSPPPSPTRSNRRSMFKRLSRAPFKDDSDSVQAPSPSVGQTKTKGLFGNGNNSQASLSKLTAEFSISSPGRKSSFDTLRPSIDLDARQNATVGAGTSQRRPSLDILRSNEDASPEASPMTPSGFGSVRSILRDPKMPGTGQNVRFFSRDAYKVISPNQSTETEFQSIIPSSLEPSPSAASQEPLFDRRSMPSGTFPVTRASTNDKAVRPSVAEVFSPMSSSDTPPPKEQVQFFESTNLMSPIPPPNFNDLDIDLPKVPPGLGFDVPEPSLDNVIDASVTDDNHSNHDEDLKPSGVATSTPIRDKGKGRVIDAAPNSVQVPDPASVDENIFHSQDKSTQIRPGLHDHSNSFSFGQTVFHSINAASPVAGVSSDSSAPDLKASLFDKDSTDLSALTSQSQNCVLNDTVFQSMMESPAKAPEADINDEYLVVYSNPEPPDPFRANATTYYTPQTMIPVTPPQGAPKHVRKTSKEENIIFSLQTQLALQTELCQQYENDLRSRDELVEILGKKLGDVEKEDLKRRSVLKTWKKKVQELERTCRYLEEEVEGSRQSSMERSIMDEASGEALRMLHRQISVLEKEKDEWVRKEEILREEIGTLEGIVKERNEDVEKLQDSLRSRDESDRESQGGIREVKEQTEHVGDVTRALIDEELEKFMVETQLKDEEERERYRSAESEWEEEKTAIVGKLQYLEAEKSNLEADLGNTKLRLEARDEEYRVLKAELDAQWERTEKTSEEVAELKEKIATLEEERGALNRDIEEFRHKMATMETEANGNEAKKAELEVQLQKVWGHKEELEREKAELEDQLHQERDHSDDLSCALQEQADRISQLDQEHQSSQENVSRLEEKLRQRDEEEKDYSQQIKQREAEAKELREEMSNLRVEHTRTLDELKRTLEEVSLQESTARAQVENLARQQATFDEVKSSADKISALKEEVERQRRRIQLLQQESADKEVKLVQLTKQHQRDKEDLEGMNTALDSKQMELELIKRTLGVRGTAGATPAPASRVTTSRRDSAIFSTPTVSRPPSSASEAGSITSKKRSSVEPSSAIKVTALGQSARSNVAPGISGSKRIEGSMGPPPPKVRPSIAGAVTSASTARVPSLSRSSSAKPSSVSSSVSVRRVASLEQSQSQVKTKSTLRQTVSPSPVPSLSEQEKENVNTSSKGATKRTLVPTPA